MLRLANDLFWYAQADGDFYSWARSHARGMDVTISDPDIYVSQVQGPLSMKVLEAASDDGMPEPFGYFGIARARFGGQEVVISRTGYTNELGWEFYTEPHHDAQALWHHLQTKGAPYGIGLHGLDSMHIRRIEAGILNAGSDFDRFTTPFDVGLGRFVDLEKGDFWARRRWSMRLARLGCSALSVLQPSPTLAPRLRCQANRVVSLLRVRFHPF